MAYFDEIKVGDKVWDFIYGQGKVYNIDDDIDAESYVIDVKFKSGLKESYNLNGRRFTCPSCNQSLFWDKINFDIPEKPKIELMEDGYLICLNDNIIDNDIDFVDPRVGDSSIDNGMFRKDRETAKKVLKQIRSFTRLLALRDQECSNSRGYEMIKLKPNWTIQYNFNLEKWLPEYSTSSKKITVYFKTEKDAQKICDILNSGKFTLEEE